MLRQALVPFARFADFSRRASRAEYWGFAVLVLALGLIAVAIELRFALPRFGYVFGPLTFPLALVTFLPGLAVQARRLHDVGLSGWWALVMWGPYVASLLYLSGWSGLDMTMMFDPGWISVMLLFSSLQALGGFALISLMIQRGKRGRNPYGEDPCRAVESMTARTVSAIR